MDEGTLGIECDNYQGGVMATELLINKGCHKLMYIGGMSAGMMSICLLMTERLHFEIPVRVHIQTSRYGNR